MKNLKNYFVFTLLLFVLSCQNYDENNATLVKLEEENQKLNSKIDDLNDLMGTLTSQMSEANLIIAELKSGVGNIKVNSLEVIDSKQKTKIKLYVDENTSRIRLFDENQKPRVSLFVHPQSSKGNGSTGFGILDDNEKASIYLGVTQNNIKQFAIHDDKNRTRIYQAVNDKENVAFQQVLSPNRKTKNEIVSFGDGRILDRIMDSNNQVRLARLVDNTNQSFQVHFDSKGNLKQGVYVPLDDSKFVNYVYRKPGTVLWDWLSKITTARSIIGK